MANGVFRFLNRPRWQVCAFGLACGLMLSVPFARTHPLRGGWGLGIGEVVVLGKDAGGTNTDTIFTLRVQPGITTITQIPREATSTRWLRGNEDQWAVGARRSGAVERS